MGTSKNLPHGRLPMTDIIYCVAKPCNTSSITAVCRLENDICHIRNSARVPVFREPLIKFGGINISAIIISFLSLGIILLFQKLILKIYV